jgi:signal transduction histidine kinase
LSQKNVLRAYKEEVDLTICLEAVLHSLGSLIKNSKAKINVDFSKFSKIKFNKVPLESVLLNLITNSIKYARPDTFPVITIYTKKEKGINQLIFTDEGQGFDMDKVKDRIFGFNEKFHEHTDSKGIGLYLVHNYITGLGGRIAIESTPNVGTTFTISFKD